MSPAIANAVIFVIAVVIWGSTWIMMKFQLGVVDPTASLTYRYCLAGIVVLTGAALAGKRIRLAPSQHLWCIAQGALMFSANYWITYIAAAHLTTGIISVFFAGVSGCTMLLALIIYQRVPALRTALGALMGVCGTALVFWPEIDGLPIDGPEIQSGFLLVLSVFLFAAGGLVGARNLASGMPRYATIGWSMFYGSCWMCLIVFIRGDTFAFDVSAPYILSLMWLIFFGSGLVFVLYFILIERIGPERASYASVMFPLVALVISTFAEGYSWPLLALIGVPLAILGNGLVLWQGNSPPAAESTPDEPEPVEWPVNIVELPEDGGRVPRDHPQGAFSP
ncbi:MAG: DMT family transporter [Pseudomonadota bacterium]